MISFACNLLLQTSNGCLCDGSFLCFSILLDRFESLLVFSLNVSDLSCNLIFFFLQSFFPKLYVLNLSVNLTDLRLLVRDECLQVKLRLFTKLINNLFVSFLVCLLLSFNYLKLFLQLKHLGSMRLFKESILRLDLLYLFFQLYFLYLKLADVNS